MTVAKKRPHMPYMEELLNQLLVEVTKDRTKDVPVSEIDLGRKKLLGARPNESI